MTPFWNVVVITLIVANIAGCLWLLIWTARPTPGEVTEGAETGHVWDDDLREYNNPLPRWWRNLFVITIVFAAVYLALYPGLGNQPGRLGWTSAGEHDQRAAVTLAQRHALYQAFDGRDIAELRADPKAVALGGKLFQTNCAGCHGVDARGAKGFPNLGDRDWLYGGSAEQVYASITQGRGGQMPSFFGTIDEPTLQSLVAYVRDLHQGQHEAMEYAAGAKKFSGTCAACHGAEGHGNTMLGAPNLSDDTWLHGGSAATIRETILYGRKSQMPSFGAVLGETERRLLSSYVLSLSEPQP
ncbi:MAG: Cbb3-type cytochrome c oxidase subunit [Hydrocarboniphaga sp.]|uniref:cytochrome-c oxidase, cbb3-type subunit III n=1 Tax=Hydrocarboniphaga sp. TaxID=2033016 RepID=UPI0026370DC1|nr:cytochrome-c oxidase, cbb3-type subunit III [Hydrocarboniphaga sp.]MDB5971353.1 Cbb3-type cytochrome c oxidase subunit [Hydrocarboniphaga sp.]